ncbi:MAG: 50S ribosomal protein L25 [Rectinemataceae bacterium]
MEHFVINASNRELTTKGGLRQNRISGKIPAVVYGSGKAARPILVDEKEFLKALASITESTIIDLDVEGKKVQAFVKERQRHAVTQQILHIDFLEVVKGKLLHARVHLHLVGIPAGVREGGVLENPAHEIEVECDPSVLPEKIDVDVTELQVNGVIHVRDLSIAAGVKVLSSPELVVAMVKFARAEEVAEPEVAAVPAAEAAAGTAGAAPATPAAPAEPEKK